MQLTSRAAGKSGALPQWRQGFVEQPASSGASGSLVLQLQRAETLLVLAPHAFIQGFPVGVGGHFGGGCKQLVEDGAARVLAKAAVAVVQQHLDANGPFNQWQLIIEQATGENLQVARKACSLGAKRRVTGSFLVPDPSPQMQGIQA